MRRAVWSAVLCSIAACGRIHFDETSAGVWPSGHRFRKAITVRSPVDTVLTAVPVSLAFQDADLAAHAAGADLLFTDEAGVELPAEVVAFDALSGLDAWVAVPTLAAKADTTLYVYYGGPDATRVTPWSSLFAGVWHMSLRSNLTLADSSPGDHPATAASSTVVPSPSLGIAGAAVTYDGVDDSMLVGDPVDALNFGMRSFSYGVWVRTDSAVGPFDIPFHHGGSSVNSAGYDIECGSGVWIASVSDGTQNVIPSLGSDAELAGRWSHLVVVVDRASSLITTYVNGSARDTADISGFGPISPNDTLVFGRTIDPYRGVLDEVRIYTSALSAPWIAAEHANLANRATFVTVGAEEPSP